MHYKNSYIVRLTMQTRAQTRSRVQEVQIKPTTTTTMKTRSQTRAQTQEKAKANNYTMDPNVDLYETYSKRRCLHQFIDHKLKEFVKITKYWDSLRLIHELYFEIYENIDVFHKDLIIFNNDLAYFKLKNVIYNKAVEILSNLKKQDKLKYMYHEAHKMDLVNRKNVMALLEKVIQSFDEMDLVM